MKRGGAFAVALLFLIISAHFVFAEGEENSELDAILNGEGRYADGPMDCSFLEFGEIEPLADEFLVSGRTDCEILDDSNSIDAYLEDVVQMEENCFERAEELSEDSEEIAERLREEIEDQNEISSSQEEVNDPIKEYADMLTEIALAQMKVTSAIGQNIGESLEEINAFQYSGKEHSSHFEESTEIIRRRAARSCSSAAEMVEGLRRICMLTNAKIIDGGGLTAEERSAALSFTERELDKSNERFNKAQEIHSEFERKGSNIENWYNAALGGEESFSRIEEDCAEIEVVKLMVEIYGREMSNSELIQKYEAAKREIEDKELAGLLGTLFGNEKANLLISDSSGGEIKMYFTTENKKVRDFGVGSTDRPTVNVNMDIETIGDIIDSGNPAVHLANGIKNDRVSYSGVGLGKKIKFGVVGFIGNLFGF